MLSEAPVIANAEISAEHRNSSTSVYNSQAEREVLNESIDEARSNTSISQGVTGAY